jgi:hypothetical protein
MKARQTGLSSAPSHFTAWRTMAQTGGAPWSSRPKGKRVWRNERATTLPSWRGTAQSASTFSNSRGRVEFVHTTRDQAVVGRLHRKYKPLKKHDLVVTIRVVRVWGN